MTTRQSTIVLSVEDKFSAPLQRFGGAMEGAAKSTDKMTAAAGKTAQIGDRLQTAFGGSSRAVNTFGNAVGNAVGLTGPLGYSLDVLIDSGVKAGAQFALLTAATVVLGKAFEEINKQMSGEYYRQSVAQAKELTKVYFDQASLLKELVKLRAQAYGADPEKTAALIGGIYEPGYVSELREIAEQQRLAHRGLVDSQAAARILQSIEEQRVQIIRDEVRAIQDATAARIAYINVAPLRSIGLGATNEEMMGLYPSGSHSVPGENDSQFDKFMKAQEAQRRQQEEAMRMGASYASQQANLIQRVQAQALQLYNSLSSGAATTSEQISNSFADAFTSIIAAQADLNNNSSISMIQLQQIFGQAFSGMSQDMVGKLLGVMDAGGQMAASLISQLYQIAAAGGSAADKIGAIKAVLEALPTDKYINIHIKMRGSGVGGQQGDEWDFVLEGESFAIRQAYMQQYGDYGAANAAWQAAHRAELAAQGVTGAGQANTQTGQTYQYAFGTSEVVRSPRMMMVGEKGPERVEITPGTAARGGGNGSGGSVNVTINSLVPPNEYEVQKLAAQLKRYMRI